MSRLSVLRIVVLGACLCFPAAAGAGQIHAALEYDTGHPLGPHVLDVGVETPLQISVRNLTGGPRLIEGVRFGFENPDGHLSWDLTGPDGIAFTPDDGFVWESGLAEPPYSAMIDPPSTVNFESSPDAVAVPAYGTVLLGTLEVTAQQIGEWTIRTNEPVIAWMDTGSQILDAASLEARLVVIPEPAAFGLLATGAAWLLARRRRSAFTQSRRTSDKRRAQRERVRSDDVRTPMRRSLKFDRATVLGLVLCLVLLTLPRQVLAQGCDDQPFNDFCEIPQAAEVWTAHGFSSVASPLRMCG